LIGVEKMVEKWSKWDSEKNLPDKMYLERLIDDKNGVSLELKSEYESVTIMVSFEDSVVSYRNSDEGRRLRTIEFLDKEYGKDFYSKWSLFKVDNSLYVKWINQETYNMYADYNIEHYVFLTANDIVDILSTYAPNINVL
jgi:hypothetical protein